MGTATDETDYVSAPKDYAELFRTYYSWVVHFVRISGIQASYQEDVASEILARFYERGFLEKFDPSLSFEHAGKVYPAKFKTFLTKFVAVYIRGQRDKIRRVESRELLICGSPAGGPNKPAASMFQAPTFTSWIEMNGEHVSGPEDDVVESIVELKLVAAIRNRLANIPKRSKYDHCDLARLFDAVVEQIRVHGSYKVRKLAETFNVSRTTMYEWMWWLETNVAEMMGRPLPPPRRDRWVDYTAQA